MTLSLEQKKALNSANREAVQEHLNNLKQFWRKGSWIQKGNLYKHDCIQKLKNFDDDNSGHHTHLSAYITASSLTHLVDGWGYLGRALSALLNGDEGVAVHLGYYAELRAAMSLLASEGVGVFNDRHFVIHAYKRVKQFPEKSGTHMFVWTAFSQLFKQRRGIDIVNRVVMLDGVSLSDWLSDSRQTSGQTDALIQDWFVSWSFDLGQLAKDRKYRNFYSYRPTAFLGNHQIPGESAISFVTQLWEFCQPKSPTQFSIFDAHLIKSGLQRIYWPERLRQNETAYKKNIQQLINKLNLTNTEGVDRYKFLVDNFKKSETNIFDLSTGKDGPGKIDHVFQVLSRALLLLRIATGSSYDHLSEIDDKNGGDTSNLALLQFWWKPMGVARAILPHDNYESEISDLWLDIEEAILSINDHLKNDKSAVRPYELFRDTASPLHTLTTTERICLWGIGL